MSEIIEGSKTIAEYLGWVYIPSNDLRGFPKAGWWGKGYGVKGLTYVENKGSFDFKFRKHNQLRFYNSFDALIPAIEKLENEDLSEFHYEWEDGRGEHNNFQGIEFNRWRDESFYDVGLELDPSYYIGRHKGEGIIKDTFHATVKAINYINNLRDEN